MRILVAVTLVWMGLVQIAQAGSDRVALVIGNGKYQNASVLTNPANDAKAIADKFESIGFDVMLRYDLTGQDFRFALGEFTEKALKADLAVVFYAGHGIEMGGANYLIPVDARMRSEATATFETVALDQMLTTVQQASKLGMVLLDACRDNPFAGQMERKNGTRSLRRGLAPVSIEGESGVLVSFAAQAGNTAADGEGMHSPYTTALLEVIDEPGLEIGRMFRKVRALVRENTDGEQVPIERMQLPDEEIYLVALPDGGNDDNDEGYDSGGDSDVTPPVATEDPLVVFLAAVRSGQKEDLEDFVSRYPNHPKADDARKLLLDIADREFWEQTVATDTEQAYRTYLIAFPDGRYVEEAKEKLAAYQQPPVEENPPARGGGGEDAIRPRPSGSCPALTGQWGVSNVPSDDTLFVRSGSGKNAKAIGELPYNASGISDVNCRSSGWCSLTYGCIRGWSFGKRYLRRGGGGQTSSFQGFYSVVDVAAHDTLNLRTGPGKSKYGNEYETVATIPYNATGIYVIDCQKHLNYRYRWCMVSYEGVSGWAYGRFLQSPSGERPTPRMAGISSGPSCQDLWVERNTIFDRKGYCFKTPRGKAYFDNSDCFTSNPQLSAAEKARVNDLKRQESRMGC